EPAHSLTVEKGGSRTQIQSGNYATLLDDGDYTHKVNGSSTITVTKGSHVTIDGSSSLKIGGFASQLFETGVYTRAFVNIEVEVMYKSINAPIYTDTSIFHWSVKGLRIDTGGMYVRWYKMDSIQRDIAIVNDKIRTRSTMVLNAANDRIDTRKSEIRSLQSDVDLIMKKMAVRRGTMVIDSNKFISSSSGLTMITEE
ncbi:MAG: hypothetical protein AAFY88_17955, partial [Acidobacteriota bacterium]